MKLENLNPKDYKLVLFGEMSDECCEKCAFYKLTLNENGGECPGSICVKGFCCVEPNGYFVLREQERTRPTSPDPSRKPWIEPFKVGDKVLIEGVVESVVTNGFVEVSFKVNGDYVDYHTFAPHQLKKQ